MTGRELIDVIQRNGLEDYQIRRGTLTLQEEGSTDWVYIYPIEFSETSQWPQIPDDFDEMEEKRKIDWYMRFLISNSPSRPFEVVDRVPNDIVKLEREVRDMFFHKRY